MQSQKRTVRSKKWLLQNNIGIKTSFKVSDTRLLVSTIKVIHSEKIFLKKEEINSLTLDTFIATPSGMFLWIYSRKVLAVDPVMCFICELISIFFIDETSLNYTAT